MVSDLIGTFEIASKFSAMHLEDYKESKVKLEAIDAWLLSRLQKVIKISTESFENYEYSKTKADNFAEKLFIPKVI